MTINQSFPQTVQLRDGDPMPALGLGTWQLVNHTAATVADALQLGYRMIDTASDYGTQPGIGDGIRESGLDRSDLFLVTKVEDGEDAYDATDRNLVEMGLDYADLMLIHRPNHAGDRQWEGLLQARDDGLTRHAGVSNYSIEEMQALESATGELPEVNQIEWSPFGWSEEMLDFCQDNDIVIQAYSPLTRSNRLREPQLREIASAHRRTPAEVLLRWDLENGIVPLPKANRTDHLSENLDVFDFQLTADDLAQLDALNEGWSALGSAPQYF